MLVISNHTLTDGWVVSPELLFSCSLALMVDILNSLLSHIMSQFNHQHMIWQTWIVVSDAKCRGNLRADFWNKLPKMSHISDLFLCLISTVLQQGIISPDWKHLQGRFVELTVSSALRGLNYMCSRWDPILHGSPHTWSHSAQMTQGGKKETIEVIQHHPLHLQCETDDGGDSDTDEEAFQGQHGQSTSPRSTFSVITLLTKDNYRNTLTEYSFFFQVNLCMCCLRSILLWYI